MPKHPPHLPPECCSLKTRERVRLIPQVLLIILISVLTGLSISLSVVAWFLPNLESGYLVKINNRNTTSVTADPAVVKLSKQRLLNFYDSRQKAGTGIYRDSAMLATGAVISTDGWAVVASVNLPVNRKQLVGMDYRGEVFAVENAIDDLFAGLTYLQVQAQGLRVTPFVNTNDVIEDYSLWFVSDQKWQDGYVGQLVRAEKAGVSYPLWRPPFAYSLFGENVPGDLILNTNGELVGFVGADKNLIPTWLINQQMDKILADKKPLYLGLPIQGYLVKGAGGEGNAAFLGFFVESVTDKIVATSITAGDIIIAINGEPLDRANLSYAILTGPEELTLKFLRAGKEAEAKVKKVVVE